MERSRWNTLKSNTRYKTNRVHVATSCARGVSQQSGGKNHPTINDSRFWAPMARGDQNLLGDRNSSPHPPSPSLSCSSTWSCFSSSDIPASAPLSITLARK